MKKMCISLAITIMAGVTLGHISGAIPGISQEVGKGNSSTKRQTFIVIYKPGPAWLSGKPISEQPLKEHGKYMLSLYIKGSMKLAGPLTDNAGGAVLLDVSNEAEARTIVAN